MHAQSLLWFGAFTLLAALFYRRMLGLTFAAGLAALFFAVDDGHGLAAGWIASRNALISGVFGLLALISHDRWRRDSWRPGGILAPLTLLLALLGGELAMDTCDTSGGGIFGRTVRQRGPGPVTSVQGRRPGSIDGVLRGDHQGNGRRSAGGGVISFLCPARRLLVAMGPVGRKGLRAVRAPSGRCVDSPPSCPPLLLGLRSGARSTSAPPIFLNDEVSSAWS